MSVSRMHELLGCVILVSPGHALVVTYGTTCRDSAHCLDKQNNGKRARVLVSNDVHRTFDV